MCRRVYFWGGAAFALAALAFLSSPPNAHAADTLELHADITSAGGGGNNPVTALDETAAGVAIPGPYSPTTTADTAPGIGTLTIGSAQTPLVILVPGGTFMVFGSTSTSNAQSPGNPGSLTSNSLSILNISPFAVTVDLKITDINYTAPPSPVLAQTSASGTFTAINGNTDVTGSSAHALAWFDSANNRFGGSAVAPSGGATKTLDFTASGLTGLTASYNAGNPVTPGLSYSPMYSMTVELIFTLAANTQLTSRADTELTIGQAVPEPSTAVSAGIAGLMGLGYGWRRRQKAKVAA
jgi:hypothetical protein